VCYYNTSTLSKTTTGIIVQWKLILYSRFLPCGLYFRVLDSFTLLKSCYINLVIKICCVISILGSLSWVSMVILSSCLAQNVNSWLLQKEIAWSKRYTLMHNANTAITSANEVVDACSKRLRTGKKSYTKACISTQKCLKKHALVYRNMYMFVSCD